MDPGDLDDKLWVLKQSLLKVVVKLGLPVGLMQAFRVIYNLVDMYWLGNYSTLALAGVSVAWPIIFLVLATFFGIYGAGTSLVSQYWGAREYTSSLKVAGQLLLFTITVGPLISALTIISTPYILVLINAPAETRTPAYDYVSILAMGVPVFGVLESITSVYMASGTPFLPLALRSLGTMLNIVLDPLLIYGLHGLPEMGVAGAALATVLSELVAGTAGLVYFSLMGVKGIKMSFHHIKPDLQLLRLMAKVGLPISGAALAEASGFTMLAGIISLMGSKALAAWSIGDRPFGVITIITAGLLTACSVIVGQSLGAGLLGKARESATRILVYEVILTSLIITPLIALRTYISSAFSPQDIEVSSYASDFMLYMGISIIPLSMLETARAIANGSGHTKPVMYLSVLRLWVLRNVLAYVFGPGPLKMGVKGLWIGMAISNVVTGLIALTWTMRYTWLKPVIGNTNGARKTRI
ncbi:MAG: MATE family efflux transporter [Desulfurococcaceae archaeon]